MSENKDQKFVLNYRLNKHLKYFINGKNVKTTERDLKKIFPEEEWNKLHIQIIMYARKFCTARNCFGLDCEICKTCYPKRIRKFKHKKP